MAWLFGTLINIRTAEGCTNKTLGTLTFAAQTQLCGWTIRIRVATRLASTIIITDFSGQTVVAGVTNLATHLLVATLSNGTGGGLLAR